MLPRARQHRDTVLALHRYPPGDPTSRTHLWLPTAYLDEWLTVGPWLAAEVGDGYVAVATEGGLRMRTTGDDAYQVFDPGGPGTAWVAAVGRRATDGSFDRFGAALGMPSFGPDAVSYRTRHGTALVLTWDGPFTVDGRPADLDDAGLPETPPHLDNPACRVEFGADKLEASYDGERLVLDLAAGARQTGADDGR
ncbi:MAG: hypothetical protein ACRDTM_02735 [Micromonosporaceae bacterium]